MAGMDQKIHDMRDAIEAAHIEAQTTGMFTPLEPTFNEYFGKIALLDYVAAPFYKAEGLFMYGNVRRNGIAIIGNTDQKPYEQVTSDFHVAGKLYIDELPSKIAKRAIKPFLEHTVVSPSGLLVWDQWLIKTIRS